MTKQPIKLFDLWQETIDALIAPLNVGRLVHWW